MPLEKNEKGYEESERMEHSFTFRVRELMGKN